MIRPTVTPHVTGLISSMCPSTSAPSGDSIVADGADPSQPVGGGIPPVETAGRRTLPAFRRRGGSPNAEAHTPAGTFLRICWRNSVNSEIDRATTVATGRGLRPDASVFDTITTLST